MNDIKWRDSDETILEAMNEDKIKKAECEECGCFLSEEEHELGCTMCEKCSDDLFGKVEIEDINPKHPDDKN